MKFTRVNKVKEFVHQFDHILLLLSLITILALPIISDLLAWQIYNVKFVSLISIVAGISVVFTTDANRLKYFLWFSNAVAVATLLDILIDFESILANILIYSQVIFYMVLTVTLLKFVLKLKQVSGEMVINAVSGYLLLGYCWSIIVKMWGVFYPEAYNFDLMTKGLNNETYYAFVTMTTLGYGDLLPVSAGAKSLALFISITGAFYTTLVMGIIVGKYISSETQK